MTLSYHQNAARSHLKQRCTAENVEKDAAEDVEEDLKAFQCHHLKQINKNYFVKLNL
jgi:hypothetical protein